MAAQMYGSVNMNWPEVPLSSVAEVTAGGPAPQEASDFSPDGIPFVRMQDVGREHHCPNLTTSINRITEETAKRRRLRLFPKGSLLIPKSGASVNLNHRGLLGVDSYVVSHLAVVIPHVAKVYPEYLYYWSLVYDPRRQAQVTSLPSLPLSLINKASLPLPPLSEQRRIVDILKRADGIRHLRKQAIHTTRELIPALFVDMFGDPATNPKGLPVFPFGDLLVDVSYGCSTKATTDPDSGLPILRMGNVTTDGRLDLDDLKYVALSDNDRRKYELAKGDILFNRTNSKDLVGKTGLWDGRFEAIAASYFIRVRTDQSRLLPTYLWVFMNTSFMKRCLFETARGAIGQANINAKELKSFKIPLPSLNVQQDYEDRLSQLRSIEVQQTSAEAIGAASFQSLLHRAFHGEL